MYAFVHTITCRWEYMLTHRHDVHAQTYLNVQLEVDTAPGDFEVETLTQLAYAVATCIALQIRIVMETTMCIVCALWHCMKVVYVCFGCLACTACNVCVNIVNTLCPFNCIACECFVVSGVRVCIPLYPYAPIRIHLCGYV